MSDDPDGADRCVQLHVALGRGDVEIVPQAKGQFRAAIERAIPRGPTRRWSLTDCASFLVMGEQGISETLAYDRDFEQVGFTALLREGQA